MSLFFKSFRRRKLEREGLASSSFRPKSCETIGYYINASKIVTGIIFTILWFFFALVLVLPSIDGKSEFYLVRDQQAPKTIYADFAFSYLDTVETNKQKELASHSAPLVYQIDDIATERNIDEIYNVFKKFPDTSNEDQIKKIKEVYGISEDSIPLLEQFEADNKRLELFRSKLSGIVYKGIISYDDITNIQDPDSTEICIINKNKHLRSPIPAILLSTPKDAAKQLSESVSIDYIYQSRDLLRNAIFNVSVKLIKPNLLFDKSLTDVEIQFISSSEKHDIYQEVNKGDIIIKKGEKIDAQILEKFQAYESQRSKKNIYANFLENFSYHLALSFVLLIITIAYFYSIHKQVVFDNQKMGTIVFVLIMSLIAVYFSLKFFNLLSSEFNIPSTLSTCIIPLALPPILITILIGIRGATFTCILVSLIAAIKVDNYYAMIIGMALGCFASLAVINSRNYKHLFIRSTTVIFLTLIPAELLCFFQPIISNVDTLLLPLFMLCIINAVATGILVLAALFLVESLFQVNTDMNLLSLCDYNHPLLKRLQMEAPGTYHHSLMVATLAERAAIDMNLNPVKARACALFHDIGKLLRPEYFTENNSSSESLHSNIRPGISSMIILNHVKDGVTLALKYKLGGLIIDAIEQHHGDDLVYFFYKKALEESEKTGGATVTENEFRYPGPKPISKEVTIVCLADSCEAASRSVEKPTLSKIETLVCEIINRKIREGQLDSSELGLEELAKARISFTKTLTSMLHSRIKYPTNEKDKNDESLLFKTQKNKLKNS